MMTAAPSTVGEVPASNSELRLGSFLLGRRIDERPFGRPSVVAMEAVGIGGSPFENRNAIVRCFPVNRANPEGAVGEAEASMARLRAVQHRAIVPVLETGIAGEVAFVAEAKPDGISLALGLATQGKLAPFQVRQMVDDTSAGLAAAHGAGLRHGRVTPANVWLGNDGSATIGGFVFGDPGAVAADSWRPAGEGKPALDQFQLALTTAAALTGEVPSGSAGGMPDSLPGVPGAVVDVLRRATAANPDDRYPDLYAFAQALGESIAHAGDDLIAGVWDATSRKDTAMAAIMLGMAEAYAPNHRDLGLLQVRAYGGTGSVLGDLSLAGLAPNSPGPIPPASPSSLAAPATPGEEAIAALLMPPRTAAPTKSRSNPWVAFAAGTFACVLLLVLITALTLAYR
jgi:hypothetical protein